MTDNSQRQKILDSATTLLAADGAAALRVREIAAAAGCSTMGVYSHFGGKDGIVEAIYVDGFERLTLALTEPPSGPTDTHLFHAGVVYRRWALENPGSYSVMFAGAVPGYAPSEAALATAAASFAALQGLVEAGQRDGSVRSGDASVMAWGIWGLVHGLVMLELTQLTPPFSTIAPRDVFVTSLRAAADYLAGKTPTATTPQPLQLNDEVVKD